MSSRHSPPIIFNILLLLAVGALKGLCFFAHVRAVSGTRRRNNHIIKALVLPERGVNLWLLLRRQRIAP